MKNRTQLPEPLRGIFFDGRWETQKIWRLPTTVTKVAMATLEWQLDLPVWSTVPGQALFDLAPRTVLLIPEEHPRHWTKIIEAELAYPLETFKNGTRWVVIDGYHRLARHRLEGSGDVPVRLHPGECWEKIRIDG